ncbi:hypothetical protein SAMN05660485_00939 [Blastococcus fimeti]|nr:hypothetical protein SAMN05660485_00939 [Blastococcus fimeti]
MAVAVREDGVKAVKLLRQRTGLWLREATETIRKWLEEEGVPWR